MTDGRMASDRVPARLLADRYLVDHCIAIGAMGEVWRGRDLALHRPVAVKLMRAKFAADGVWPGESAK